MKCDEKDGASAKVVCHPRSMMLLPGGEGELRKRPGLYEY